MGLHYLSQLSTGTEFTTPGSGVAEIFAGMMLFAIVIGIAAYIFTAICMAKIFQKAGVEGWKAWVPVYNNYVTAELAGKPGWWGLVTLTAGIPVLGYLGGFIGMILMIIVLIELVKRFGKDSGFAVLMILLPVVGYPMLAFGDATYTASAGSNSSGPDPAPATPEQVPPAPAPTAPAAAVTEQDDNSPAGQV